MDRKGKKQLSSTVVFTEAMIISLPYVTYLSQHSEDNTIRGVIQARTRQQQTRLLGDPRLAHAISTRLGSPQRLRASLFNSMHHHSDLMTLALSLEASTYTSVPVLHYLPTMVSLPEV